MLVRVCSVKVCLTKRAVDGGYAPRPKRVCPFGFFLRSGLSLPSPAAANVDR